MAISKLNHTQISNDFLDNHLSNISGNAAKVFLVISRKTIGWHKDTDKISDSQIQKIAGLSRNTVRSSLKELVSNDLIVCVRGQNKARISQYEISYGSKSNPLNSDSVQNVTPKDDICGLNIDPTKERVTKYKESKDNCPQADAAQSIYPPTDGQRLWTALYDMRKKTGSLPMPSDKGGCRNFYKLEKQLCEDAVKVYGLDVAAKLLDFASQDTFLSKQPITCRKLPQYQSAYKAQDVSDFDSDFNTEVF